MHLIWLLTASAFASPPESVDIGEWTVQRSVDPISLEVVCGAGLPAHPLDSGALVYGGGPTTVISNLMLNLEGMDRIKHTAIRWRAEGGEAHEEQWSSMLRSNTIAISPVDSAIGDDLARGGQLLLAVDTYRPGSVVLTFNTARFDEVKALLNEWCPLPVEPVVEPVVEPMMIDATELRRK